MPTVTSPIIKNQQVVNDYWQQLNDEESIPATGDILISVQRWQQDKDCLTQHNGKLGILIGFNQAVQDIIGDLQHFELVAIEFQSFADGRGYSYARLLRDRYAYTKEIRAIGDVLRDQLFYMYRCGFNAFAIRADRDIHDALNAFNDFSVAYQPAAEAP